jgi:hypothetical protein
MKVRIGDDHATLGRIVRAAHQRVFFLAAR